MNIISYNVNGIRATINKGLIDWLKQKNSDIICFQEIKLSETELVQPIFEELGFHCYWFPAQKKGYSGVGIITKIKPNNFHLGNGYEVFDFEGRILRLDFDDFSLITCYFPSGTTGEERQNVKFKFLDDFLVYITELRKTVPNLILCGDVNICHREIDIHNPKSNQKTSGFLPEERAWVGKFLDTGFIDTFRHFNQDPHHYTWWSLRFGARSKNLGWRIDYFFATQSMQHRLKNAVIHPEIMFSDHCPIELEII